METENRCSIAGNRRKKNNSEQAKMQKDNGEYFREKNYN
ncbi:hypothetical protein PIN17_A1040 [Prevotella intermedia 17]|nr:hypothetical protein PIN17_A1040 [Prevotella intermedia 17]